MMNSRGFLYSLQICHTQPHQYGNPHNQPGHFGRPYQGASVPSPCQLFLSIYVTFIYIPDIQVCACACSS